jgi:hypothetical protein
LVHHVAEYDSIASNHHSLGISAGWVGGEELAALTGRDQGSVADAPLAALSSQEGALCVLAIAPVVQRSAEGVGG